MKPAKPGRRFVLTGSGALAGAGALGALSLRSRADAQGVLDRPARSRSMSGAAFSRWVNGVQPSFTFCG